MAHTAALKTGRLSVNLGFVQDVRSRTAFLRYCGSVPQNLVPTKRSAKRPVAQFAMDLRLASRRNKNGETKGPPARPNTRILY
uniref:Transposase n=1 Tax=Bursaphelenchus xylophilus TaxID=6326 RepID=A0A1I7SC04_BURXY